MNSLQLRADFHSLIDNFQNENVLSKFYELLNKINQAKDGELWARLAQEEQEELLEIIKTSEDTTTMVSNSDMQKKFKKWL
jgi:hypothetical protein